MNKEELIRAFANGANLTQLKNDYPDLVPIYVIREFVQGVFVTIESLSRKMHEAATAKEAEG